MANRVSVPAPVPAPAPVSAPGADPVPDYDHLLGELEKLSRNHLLYFRIEVGRAVAAELYGGDAQRYLDQLASKEGSLRAFATTRSARLADLGLDEQGLRLCLRAWFVVQSLPNNVVQHLAYTHVVELSRVADDQTRLTLAHAIVENHWTGQEIRDAVLAVRAGRWIDADPGKPGLQPPPAPPEGEEQPKPAAAGRVVNRVEKRLVDLDGAFAEWEALPPEKVTPLQADRIRDGLGKLKERIAGLEARLGLNQAAGIR